MKVLPLALLLFNTMAIAQGLPHPSRTVYRCESEGKVIYSDEPCLGAKKVDVEPTRGLNKSTGQELQGRDVRNERFRETVADAAQPLTGMDAKQFDQAGRRQRLSAADQRQCRLLDQRLPAAEAAERAAKAGAELVAAQRQVFELRKAYRTLRCE
ncbi:DUF4124 domain-containing protein [Pelomonas cellulosilytica]|uniref:DUF4124 domain-containing protein n=1 Tax=Pelomonas cellulosilytica TaxID=2906762 RepID=A0ABS8XSG7_9BURK|nr:DUF4124 domain-containing protein [Pelomonas sp. P8]MCE4555649.1 DUF4124 domain-containing protein [Pelomonas sp. P8]